MRSGNFYHKKRKILPSILIGFAFLILRNNHAAPAPPSFLHGPPVTHITAHELTDSIGSTTGTRQQEYFVKTILNGQVPNYSQHWYPVRWKVVLPDSHGTLIETDVCINVLPDYLAIGTNDDFLRIPLTPDNAQNIADLWNATLPTPAMVNRIYQAATIKLAPQPISPKEYPISELPIWQMSNELINQQISQSSPTLTPFLFAGHKKDVVITNRLKEPVKSPRVAIYGWHKLDGKAIQPLTLVHVWWYVDYSHGIRLVSDEMLLGGKKASVKAILRDPATAFILSDEGTMDDKSLRYQY